MMALARANEEPCSLTFDTLASDVRAVCDEFSYDKVTLAIPALISDDTVVELLAMPEVASVVLSSKNETLNSQFPGRIGWFYKDQRRWCLPLVVTRSIQFFGTRREISFGMGPQALRHWATRVVMETPFGWCRATVVGLIVHRLLRIFVVELILGPAGRTAREPNSVLRRLFVLLKIGSVARLVVRPSVRLAIYIAQKLALWKLLSIVKSITTGQQAPLLQKTDFVRGRILLVNSALAWGGAERQLVNTAVGLASCGRRDVIVLCDNSANVPDNDFFKWQLEAAGIEVRHLSREVKLSDKNTHLRGAYKQLRGLNFFGFSLRDELGYYVHALLELRPDVVHAWQDQTAIKAGIAAALVGVPTVVLSGRNMAPYHFRYNLPYMRDCYKVLLRGNSIQFLNNSRAGALDYANWLKLPADRLRVIHNGFDTESLVLPETESIDAYRERLGIPNAVRIVGSVFRLYEEKDPMLWVRTAARICKSCPDVVFLIVGTGVMHAAVLDCAERMGIGDRLFMPGAEKHPALAYGLMDVFLLTSRLEGLPNVVLEAQFLGVPVVATNAGGTREAVLEGKTGFVLEDRDPESLSERVQFILNSPAWTKEARLLSSKFVRERFGVERMIKETLDVYEGASRYDRSAIEVDSEPAALPPSAVGDLILNRSSSGSERN